MAGVSLPGTDFSHDFRDGQVGRGPVVRDSDADLEASGPDFQGLLVDADVHLAPDASLRNAVPGGVPLPFAVDVDPGAFDLQVQWTNRSTAGDVDLQGLQPP